MSTITSPPVPAATVPSTTTASVTRTVLALGRVEAWRLVRHPFLLAGTALAAFVFVIGRGESGAPSPGDRYYILTVMIPILVAYPTLLAANLGALRTRRAGTGELFAATPIPAGGRTMGHLAALPAVVGILVLLWLGSVLTHQVWDGLPVAFPDGVRPRVPTLPEFLQAPLAILALGAVGVALARWVPSVAATLLVLVVMVPGFVLQSWGVLDPWAPLFDPAIPGEWIETGADGSGYSIIHGFDLAALAWHEVYLAGVAALFGGLALLRDGWRRGPVMLLLAGVAATATGGVLQVIGG
ncbi:MAG: hypothetical protein KY469_09910 [Actinobacteria bacterium]|nr:hypothetical protein [Actinomycetota bacterium]